MIPDVSCQKGVTLLELMVAMAIAGVIAAAMFSFQQVQTRSYVTQEAFTNMQQNARAAMHFMTREIRMAGCDPSRDAGAGIVLATDDSINFTSNFSGGAGGPISIFLEGNDNNNNDNLEYQINRPNRATDQPGENITYELRDGNLIRIDHNGGGDSVIAQNIDALDFVYLDADGNRIDTGVSGNLNARERNQVRAIQITLLARSGADSPGFVYRHTDNTTYRNRWSENDPTRYPDPLFPPANDNFRRILMSTEVRLRNM